ncbi:MAG: hypothetical protein DRJ03_11690 [Chloroflexi bacterium]|nr:MAG: hypothetical protein DRJ03_11690 [Chloroflexota bacterium]
MISRVTKGNFYQEFAQAGRADSWSYNGLEVLYDYLEENYPDMEVDPVGLDGSFAEYEVDDLIAEHDIEVDPDYLEGGEYEDEDEVRSEVIKFLERKTSVIGETSLGTIVLCTDF